MRAVLPEHLPTSGFRCERFVADLEELREHFGHSSGAHLGSACTAAHPDRVDALVHRSGTGPSRPAHREDRVRAWEQEVRWRTLTWIPDFADPGSAERLALAATRVELPVNLACNTALNAESSQRTSGSRDEVDVPVLVLQAADPRPVAGVRELLPRAELHVHEGAGHHPWVERPEEFTAVRDFLAATAHQDLLR